MPLRYLRPQDFTLERGQNGILMTHNVPGICIVLFYSSVRCETSAKLFPAYKKMHSRIVGCNFAAVDLGVSQNRQVIKLSRQSITPLTHVPHILLYVNGRPYKKYQGEYHPDQLGAFIMNIIEQMQGQQSFGQVAHRPKKVKKAHKAKEGELPWGAIAYNVMGSHYQSWNKAYKRL